MKDKPLQVLLVEDSAGDARLLREMFRTENTESFVLTHVDRMSGAITHLQKGGFDIVLLDMGLPDGHGLDTVRRAHAAAPDIPLIVLTGMDDEEMATQAMKEGAQDYLVKGQIENRALPRALRYAIERHRMLAETELLRKQQLQLKDDDVTTAQATALQMTHTAEHDFLTGLPNRMLLNDRVSQAIAMAPRHRKKVAVLFLDLDGFKQINDSLGHPIGDKLLQSIAARLVSCVRGADTVSRQGGDEFVVLLSEVERSEDAAITARRMLKAVAEPQSIDERELQVTTSIGVSIYPHDGLNAETLIKNADIAMYQAKANRRGYQFFKPAMNIRAVERQSIEDSLRRALEQEEFTLHYQPKVNLKTGAITGAEALVRWQHPERGLVVPRHFVSIAESCGLMLPIGRWILREACRQAKAWQDQGLPPIEVAVNTSLIEFRSDGFPETVRVILTETGLKPRYLELELKESVLMQHAEFTVSVLQTFKAMGVRLAVDDFGTGYSSLSYLRQFPIDTLKVDQSFVREIDADTGDIRVLSAVINIGGNLKYRVIAEGVETAAQVAFLQSHGCDEGQGFYFGRPSSASEFAKLLETGTCVGIKN
jgi:diguanylate cyclase (GGDEF)-like protein